MSKTFKHIYTKAKAVDKSCRKHGNCSWCKSDRLYSQNKALESSKQKLVQYNNDLAFTSHNFLMP